MNIDGKNIKTEYGYTLLDGCLGGLLKYPKRKPVPFNNYAESNGIEPDLSTIEFEPKPVKLEFAMQSGQSQFYSKYNNLITTLSAPGVRAMEIEGMTFKLRFDQNSAYKYYRFGDDNCTVSSLDFFEDTHSVGSAVYPTGGIPLSGFASINGIDFADFGISSESALDDLLRYPAVKPPFTDGNKIDLTTVRFQHKEIKLPLWMTANSKAEFLNNHAAFFNQFNRTGTQDLYINSIGATTQVYYLDCPSFDVPIWNGKIGTTFTISLMIPVVTWIDAGGTTRTSALFDITLGYLADENNNILTLY